MVHKQLAVAFGSGGVQGLGSLGVMSVLAKHGIRPAAVSGSSMGAVIAAYYGAHGETETLRHWYESRKAYEFYMYMIRPNLTSSLISTNKLRMLLDGFFERKRFEETVVPVRIIATNLRTGQQRVFSEGKLIDAVMPSIAIPGILPACKIGGEYYVDGGVVNPTPVDAFPAARYGHFLAVDFHFHIPRRLERPNAFATISRSMDVATHTAFEHHLQGHNHKCTVVTLCNSIEPEVLRFDHSRQYIAFGERAGRRLIKEWKESGLYDELCEPQIAH
jgi:NTE family protein